MFTPALALISFGGFGLTSLCVYLIAACVIPLAIFWRPILGLYILIPLMPLQTLRYQLHVFPFGDKLVDALLISVLLGLFLHRDGTAVFLATRLNRVLLFFCIFLYAMLWCGSLMCHLPLPILPSDSRFDVWKNTVEMPLLFIVVTAVVKDVKQMKILFALMMITILRANLGFYHTVSDRDLSHFSNQLRYAGVFGYAGQNGLAAFMAEWLTFLLAFLNAFRSIGYKLMVYASIVLAGYCVLLCFSRGAYVGIIVGLIFLGLAKHRKYLVVVAILLTTWQTIVPDAVRERVLMTYDGQEVESSANERLQLWEDAFTIIPQHPILGTGFDTYRFLARSSDYTDTHNYFVKVTVETGFVGLGLFLYLLWLIFREGMHLSGSSQDPFFQSLGLGLAGLIACAVAVNFFGDRWMYQQITAYMWTLLGFVCRAATIEHERTASLVESAFGEDPHSVEMIDARIAARPGVVRA